MLTNLTGVQYLQAEIACKFDKNNEKKKWEERLHAFHHEIDFNDPKLYSKASNPIGLSAALQALSDTIDGKASGYMISLDATSSGLQILSMLVSCPKSFELCGGHPTECVDSYVTIYDAMNLHGMISRKQVKSAIMTSLYGSTAMPEITFGDNIDLFYETMEKMAPGAWDLNLGLQELWDMVQGPDYDWVLPDNFHACIETKDKTHIPFMFDGEQYDLPVKVSGRPDFHKGLGPNVIHSVDGMIVREMFRRCMYNQEKLIEVIEAIQSENQGTNATSEDDLMVLTLWQNYLDTGFLSARIIDHLNVGNIGNIDCYQLALLIQSLPEKPFDIVSVHDCFRAHPNYGNDLRRQYNYILADINDSHMLESLCQQVSKSKIKVKKLGTIPREVVLHSNYSLS